MRLPCGHRKIQARRENDDVAVRVVVVEAVKFLDPDDGVVLIEEAASVARHGSPAADLEHLTRPRPVPSAMPKPQFDTSRTEALARSSTAAATLPKNSASPDRRLTPMTMRSQPPRAASRKIASSGATSTRIVVLISVSYRSASATTSFRMASSCRR